MPSPPRYGGRPQYCSDFVVRADAAFTALSDTFGGRIGWTVEDSQSGYSAVRHHLMRYRSTVVAPLYRQWVGPLVTPRRVINAVIAGDIDVGPLDSYVHDLLKRNEPETASRLRIVESTAMTPIPALVASEDAPADSVERLRSAFLSIPNGVGLSSVLDTLTLSHFTPVAATDYSILQALTLAAARAGVEKP